MPTWCFLNLFHQSLSFWKGGQACFILHTSWALCLAFGSHNPQCIQVSVLQTCLISQRRRGFHAISSCLKDLLVLQKQCSNVNSYQSFILFQGVVKCIMLLEHFQRRHGSGSDQDDMPPPPTTKTVADMPYENRYVRSAIDGCAFQIYGHWVDRGERHNRAAMFENQPKQTRLTKRSTGTPTTPTVAVLGPDWVLPSWKLRRSSVRTSVSRHEYISELLVDFTFHARSNCLPYFLCAFRSLQFSWRIRWDFRAIVYAIDSLEIRIM